MQYTLIFTGGDHPAKEVFDRFTSTFFQSFAASFVIAADSGLHCAESFGYSPDLIIGDMDSIEPNRLEKYPQGQRRMFDRNKDETDTVLALQEAAKHSTNPIVLCGGDGGRIDHLLGIVKQFERSPAPDIWLCREQVLFYLHPDSVGKPTVLHIPAKNCRLHLSVFPVHSLWEKVPYLLRSEGLVWPLDGVDWKHGGFSLSNRITDDYVQYGLPVRLTAETGAFLVIVPYE